MVGEGLGRLLQRQVALRAFLLARFRGGFGGVRAVVALVFGGHVAHGCKVRTTAELLLALLPAHAFSREPDPRTGFVELVIREVS